MKTLSFILVAALASSTAYAQPWHRDDRRGDYDRRTDESRDAQRDRWVPLATLDVGRRQGVELPATAAFSRLRIRAVQGITYVSSVDVMFANGERQRIDIGRRMGRGEVVDADLAGGRRQIRRLRVNGRPDRFTRIEIVGLR
jgi:hypothetical protein